MESKSNSLQTISILLVEDVEDDAQLLLLELLKGGIKPDYLRVDTAEQLKAALESDRWDAIFSDYSLPSFTGLDALRIVQAKGLDLPFILVSGAIGEEQAVEALKAGAHDFIIKGSYARLVSALERALKDATLRRERKQTLEDLQHARDELENRVQQRTNELAKTNEALLAEIVERKWVEDELQRAKEAAENANRVKSQFLANMSHELRTPMTGVLGMLDLALASNLEAEQQEYISAAHTSALSMVRILNDILDMTKIEAGVFSIVAKPFSIRKCLENTINILLPVAKSKGFALNFTVADNVSETMIGDQVRLSHVLTNLAGNAVKFTEKGKVEICVAAGDSTPGARREVSFTVSDTGIGIPDDKKGHLFRIFSQVDESHTRTYGGTGLGLAISKEIVERMGGTIGFTSEEGKGSTFFCTIPFGEAEAERDIIFTAGKTTQQREAPRAVEATKPRLLIAEDDQTIIQVLGAMLKMAKYEVAFAENGQKVVEMWENGQYDLILMDIQMPRMNGFEATAAIREIERTRGGHIPIIAMTAHAFKEDEQKCLDAGMDAYISKPIDFMDCLQLIEDNLKNSGGVL